MFEVIRDHYAYWFIFLVLVAGLYGMLAKKNLMKKIIGMTIFQSAIILFFIVSAYKRNASVPVIDAKIGEEAAQYINPLPHTLMLTAIVVGVAIVGVALALAIKIYKRYGTLEEPALLERMK